MLILLRPSFLAAVVLTWLMLVWNAGPARGDFVSASNLGPNDQFSVSGGYTLSGAGTSSGVGLNIAVQFTQGGTGSSTFQAIRLALGYRGGANSVEIRLMTDAGDAPGSVLESMRLIDRVPGAMSLVEVASALHPSLIAGQKYWLAVLPLGDATLVWATNSLGQSGHLATQSLLGSSVGNWNRNSNTDTAYQVTAASMAVPEPSSLTLCGIFGVVMLGRRWWTGP